MAKNSSKKKKGYTVPKSEQHAYKMLVQKANRHIKANLKIIEQYNIQDMTAKRVLLNMYENRDNWATSKTALSRSVKFDSKTAYKQYLKHLEKMATNTMQTKIDGYQKAILTMLEKILIENNIAAPGSKLSDEIVNAIKGLTFEQLVHWFNMGNPDEDIESHRVGTDDYAFVTEWEDFVNVTMTRIADLKRVF